MSETYVEQEVIDGLVSDYIFYRKQITSLQRQITREKKTVDTNGGKTLMQNPKIKTLNEFTKNMLATISQIRKMINADSEVSDNELLNFLQTRNKK